MHRFAQNRRMMVDCQVRTFDVTDHAVIDAMLDVPREIFTPQACHSIAYSDCNVPVSDKGRFMLIPMMLARLIQALAIQRGNHVLDIACGLGYSSALLARIGATVTALEEEVSLSESARLSLKAAGFDEVEVRTGPLDKGFSAKGPYDAILVNGSIEERPSSLLAQLAEDGRLVCAEGSRTAAKAMIYTRSGDAFGARTLFDAPLPALNAFRRAPAFVF